MKCKQKSCNRNKNLLSNGYCSVFHEAIMEINAEHDAKKKVNEALVKDLIDFNKKLRKGEIVDQGEAIRMIMGGIIALISKKAGIDEHFEAKINFSLCLSHALIQGNICDFIRGKLLMIS